MNWPRWSQLLQPRRQRASVKGATRVGSVPGQTWLVSCETHQAADLPRTELTATAVQMMQRHAQQVMRDILEIAEDEVYKDLMEVVDETTNFKKRPDWRHECHRK